ncbi:MAG TPA: DUF1801 domain-containing protein [Chitinophagaceae bacterium]
MGKLAEIKTKVNSASVQEFINKIADVRKRQDSQLILEMMEKATTEKPQMWGTSIVGFGHRRYKSPATGREVEWFKIGFSPRKANISLYFNLDLKAYGPDLSILGKHKTGVGCLYINKIEEIDLQVLRKIINAAAEKQKG